MIPVFDRLGSPTSTTQSTQDSGAALLSWRQKGPSTTIPKKQEVWQGFFVYLYQTTLTGPRWGLAWRSLLGICRATGIVEDGVGIAFQQRPQLTHQSISFQTSNSRQDLQQAVDDLLMKGAIERVSNVTRLMWCLPSCSDESGCPQISAFRGQQGVPVHLSSVWTGNLSTRVHLAAANRVSLLGSKVWSYTST